MEPFRHGPVGLENRVGGEDQLAAGEAGTARREGVLVIAWRGLRAAVLAPDRFGTLLGIGLTTMIAVQAFINLSVVTGLFPNKGMPLPFVSNGGSSLVINLIGMGILLNISQQASTVAAVKTGVDPDAPGARVHG